jgi:hypothetical protein
VPDDAPDEQPIDAPPPDTAGIPFTIPVAVLEGVRTSDRREIAPGALAQRALPMPLQATDESAHGGIPGGAVSAGRIEVWERYDASDLVEPVTGQTYREVAGGAVYAWRAEGRYNADDVGLHYATLAATGSVRGISVDLGVTQWEEEILEVDEDGWPTDWVTRVTEGETMGMTQVPFPAFAGAYIVVRPEDVPGLEVTDEQIAASAAGQTAHDPSGLRFHDMTPGAAGALVAAGAPTDGAAPAAWFVDPQLPAPTPLTVTDDGRVFGHIAAWGTCHTGIASGCVTPPRSRTGYGYFRTGEWVTQEGERVPVGRITVGTGHADTRLGLRPAVEHYDNTGAVAAYVAAGDDAHGIWVAGQVVPGADDATVRQLRAHPPSGDWRAVGGNLELVGVLAVNVPGYPIPRARVAAGQPAALVAAGAAPLAALRPDRAARGLSADVVRRAVDEAVTPVLNRLRHRDALDRIRRR